MRLRRFALPFGALALLALAATIWANIRLEAPKDFLPPIYTSLAGPLHYPDGSIFVIQDGEWAAIPFWRPPACVPEDFNLFDLVDFDAVDCPLLVEGFAIWQGTAPVGFPAISEFRGLGEVPVWFVRLDELQAASADGELTIVELASLDSLRVGTAHFYHEQNHTDGVHPVSHLAVVARGTLEGGGSFDVRAVEVGLELEHVQISFK